MFFRQNRAQILITRGIRSEAQVHRSGHHAFLSGHRAFLSGAVFFSHNRIKKSQNTTLVCEIHGVRGENPFENLPAHPATAARRAAQSSRRRPSLPQRLVIFGAGPHREDGVSAPLEARIFELRR